MTAADELLGAIGDFYGARPPARLGVAVSGGSDSLGLLHLLHQWGGSDLSVITVDHGLRPEAAGEALHVARLCEGLGLPHRTVEWTGWDGRGNLQDQARRTRYSMIADWARGEGIARVALGHTLDDQAETFLMRLSRAAGIDGLSAMAPRFDRHGVGFDRPVLGCRRAALRGYLSSRGVRWVEDPSNEDDSFDRVKARQALEALAPLGIGAGTLSEVAGNLALARDALDATCVETARRIANVIGGDVLFDRAALRGQPPEIARRLVAAALRWISGAEYPPRRAALAALWASIARGENATLSGCLVLVSAMTVRIVREPEAVASLAAPTDAPWDGRWRLEGAHAPDLEIRALGAALPRCDGWRQTGMPRASLLSSPAVWRGDELVAAPVAGLANGWTASAPDRDDFAAFLIRH